MAKRKKIIIELTEAEHHAILMIIGNGWGNGDFAGWGGQNPRTQMRAMEKVRKASKD